MQIIHNAADPAAAVVDIYVEEISTEDPAVEDVAFRSATPFIDLPTGIEVTVTVAPGDSDSAADGLASFPFTLNPSLTYQIVATGVLAPDDFEANPDGEDIGFQLLVNTLAQETGTDADEVDINVVHSATDAPTVDVVGRLSGSDPPGGILFDDATYTDIAPYISVPPAAYELDITTADNSVTVATFAADLSGAAGGALTVLASGFLSPGNDQDGPAFGLLAVFPDGTTALLPVVEEARLQVIHNAADPTAAVVDVYVEEVSTDTPFIEDFAFRTATPYVDVPAGTELTVTVAPGNSVSAADGIASFNYTLDAGETYQLIANGVLSPDDFEANPDGEDIGFTLFVNGEAREASTDTDEVQFNVVHGSTDAPTVDVVARDVATLVDDATYGDITGYVGVPAASYTLDVTTADGSAVAATFAADLSGAAGGALTVLASGFLSPGNDQNGPAFGLLAVFPDGATALLPPPPVSSEDGAAAPASFELSGAYPNPFRNATTVAFTLPVDARIGLEIYDVLGRRVLEFAPEMRTAGADQQITVDARALPSGAYLYRLTAETATETISKTGRMTVVR